MKTSGWNIKAERNKYIIDCYKNGNGMKQKDIAIAFEISVTRVRQILKYYKIIR